MPDTLSCSHAVRAHSHPLGEKDIVEGNIVKSKNLYCQFIFTVVYIKSMKINLKTLLS